MIGGAGTSKKIKTYHFQMEWEEEVFFQDDIFEVRLPHLPVYHNIFANKYLFCIFVVGRSF